MLAAAQDFLAVTFSDVRQILTVATLTFLASVFLWNLFWGSACEARRIYRKCSLISFLLFVLTCGVTVHVCATKPQMNDTDDVDAPTYGLMSAYVPPEADTNVIDSVEVQKHIRQSVLIFDNHSASVGEFTYALELCGADTNRFVSEMKEVVASDRNGSRSLLLRDIGRFGSQQDVEFLSNYMTNHACCIAAISGVMQISGLSTQVVDAVSGILTNRNVDCDTKVEMCALIWRKTFDVGLASDVVATVREKILRYASGATNEISWLDFHLRNIDPIYQNSKRRLLVLRAINQLDLNETQKMYVTNAINGLITYPESQLYE